MSTVFLFLVLGAATGALYAFGAAGIVLVYRGSGVINFASGGMGMAGAFLFYALSSQFHWPTALAVICGVLGAGLLGGLTHLLMVPLRQASNLTRVIVTLAVLTVLEGGIGLIYAPDNNYTVGSLLPTGPVHFLGIAAGRDRLLLIALAAGLTVVLTAGYRYTKFGLATRAVAENETALSTLGWSSRTVAWLNWIIGAGLAALGMILLSPTTGLSVGSATEFLLPSLAAAVIGNLSSFPLTFVGAIGIGILQSELGRYTTIQGIGDVVPFAAIILFVVLRGRKLPLRGDVVERLPMVTDGVIKWRKLLFLIFIGLVLIELLHGVWLAALTFTLIGAVMLESIVIITGFCGQISLAQWPIAGCGALVFAWLRADGLPFELAIPIGVLAGLPIGLMIGGTSLRARGMSLAIGTLGFGVVLISLLLTNYAWNGGNSGLTIGNLHLFGIQLEDPHRYAIFALVVLVLVGLCLANTRRGRTGRQLLAVRANERAAAALGLSVYGVKLAAFCYSAMIACLGGILSVALFPLVTVGNFDSFTSIQLVDYAVLGGVGFITGPLFGAQGWPGGLASQVADLVTPSAEEYVIVILSLMLLFVIVQAPNGMGKLNFDQFGRNGVRLSGVVGRLEARGWKLPWLRTFGHPVHRSAYSLSGLVDEPGTAGVALPATNGHQVNGTSNGRPTPKTHFEVRGLVVRFGAVTAVDDVSFELKSGEVLGIIGPNGAGKTTIIDALTGFVDTAAGEFIMNGEPIRSSTPRSRALLGISRSFQSVELFEDLKVFENLLAACEKHSIWTWVTDVFHPGLPEFTPAARTAIKMLRLEQWLDAMPGSLTYGTRRLVAIARAISSDPKIILLDEPAAGLDQRERAELAQIIRALTRDLGMAVLLIEHDVPFVCEVSDRMLALNFGQVMATGTPDEVRTDKGVITSYLGGEDEDAAAAPSLVDR